MDMQHTYFQIEKSVDTEQAAELLINKLQQLHNGATDPIAQQNLFTNIETAKNLKQCVEMLRKSYEKKLPEYFNDPGVQYATRKLGVGNPANFFAAHLEHALVHEDADVRMAAVKYGELSDAQLERALTDKDSRIRVTASQRKLDKS